MSQLNVREQVIAGPLQNVSIAYRNLQFIGDRVFPIIDGSDPKAKIYKYLKGAWFRDEAGVRAPGTRARRGGYTVTPVSIATLEYAYATEVTDEDRRFAASRMAPPLQPDTDAIEFATDKIDLKKEIRIAALVKASTWVDGNSGGEDAEGLWAPAGNTNTFLADIVKGKKAMKAQGILANSLLMDYATFLAVKRCDDITGQVKYTSADSVTTAILARILELDEVMVGMAIYSSAKETAAGTEFTAADIWEINAGKGMGFLFYRAPRLGLKVVTAGIQARIAYENGSPRRTATWREAAEHQDVYEVAEETDIIQVCADAGYMWADTYAT